MTSSAPNSPGMSRPFDFLPLPAVRSQTKPRKRGLTMMIDQGLPAAYVADLAATAGDYIDLAKIKTGTARLYPEAILRAKLDTYKAHGITPFVGGQFHEYVLATQGTAATMRFYAEAKRIGFGAMEVSDNVISLTDADRRDHIKAACDAGLDVFGEVGSKDRRSRAEDLIAQADICLSAGARLVLIEAAELVIDGQPDRKMLEAIRNGLDPAKIMIELPGAWIPGVRACDIEALKKILVLEFGPDINVANVSHDTIIDFEATRTGLGVAGPFLSAQLGAWQTQ
jgi:phosphosulfolactate synthase